MSNVTNIRAPLTNAERENSRDTVFQYFCGSGFDAIPLVYGVNDFPPFVSTTPTQPQLALSAFFESVSAQLGIPAKATTCKWSSFVDQLASRTIFSLAAPIMPIHSGAYDIVDMFQLGCCAAFCSTEVSEKKKRARAGLFDKVEQEFRRLRLKSWNLGGELARIDSAPLKAALATLVREFSGWATGADYFEARVLEQYIDAKRFNLEGDLPVQAALRAVEDGKLVIIDLTTLRQIEVSIGTEALTNKYHYRPLFGDYVFVDAGPMFVGSGEDGETLPLADCFAEFWREDREACRSKAIEQLRESLTLPLGTPLPFKIREPGEVQVVSSEKGNPMKYLFGSPTTRPGGNAATIVRLDGAEPATVLEVGAGRHRYRLANPDALSVVGNIAKLAYLEGTGSSPDVALSDLGLKLHQEFQRLWRVLPHERTDDESNRWMQLSRVIDLEDYLVGNREPETIIGRVLSINDGRFILEIVNDLPDGGVEVSVNDLPKEAAGSKEGEGFSARRKVLKNGMVVWSDWKFRKPVRNDEAVWDEFEVRRNGNEE